MIISYVLWPVALVMGVDPIDCRRVAELVGLKITINEFVAYTRLSALLFLSETDLLYCTCIQGAGSDQTCLPYITFA